MQKKDRLFAAFLYRFVPKDIASKCCKALLLSYFTKVEGKSSVAISMSNKKPRKMRGFLLSSENYRFCFFDLKKLPVLRLLPSGLPIRSIAQRNPIVLLA
jgi:hypothetical protein